MTQTLKALKLAMKNHDTDIKISHVDFEINDTDTKIRDISS